MCWTLVAHSAHAAAALSKYRFVGTSRRRNKILTVFVIVSGHDSISPVLLNRARSIAAEHARLSAQIAENYDVDVARRVGELGVVTSALKEWEDARQVYKDRHFMSTR